MKIADAKKVADLITKHNDLARELTKVNSGEVMFAFGDKEVPRRDWYVILAGASLRNEVRERVQNSLMLEIEKCKEELTALGVEL